MVAASGSAHEKLVKNSGGLVSRETEWRRGRHTTRRLPVWSATTMLRPPARACSAAVGARQVNDHGLLRVSERRRRHTFLSIQRLRCHCHNIGRLRGCRGEADALCWCGKWKPGVSTGVSRDAVSESERERTVHDGDHVAVREAWKAQRGQCAGGNEETARCADEPPHSDTATLSTMFTCVCPTLR